MARQFKFRIASANIDFASAKTMKPIARQSNIRVAPAHTDLVSAKSKKVIGGPFRFE